ncbi:carbohydrate kinase FGGY [Microbacterium esteraromaticum]|uniref:Carbohydrate kinase FGGY n=1 Tax=Microbacterium esteraromaticum TaxID=57043 RepID=A0A1R4K6E5_9MICO|nr:carbohydrate kinase FGGY [Microbacterium esteraromaticum]
MLGIDAGQTAVKAVVHDATLRPVATGRSVSPIDRSGDGYAERSHEALWHAVRTAIAGALRRVDPARIGAVAVSGHGDGLHLVDAAGRGVGPAITAMDSRARHEADEIAADPARSAVILARSGQASGASSPGALLLWAQRNRPEWIDAAQAMVFCKDVVRLRLTGDIVTDYSDATASFLEVDAATWSQEVLDAYGVGGLGGLLPPLQGSAAPVGGVTRTAAEQTGLPEGVPVLTGLHDVQASSIGMGALRVGRLACVAGSFNTNGVTTDRTDVDARWQSRLSITPDLRIAMSTSSTASPTLDWALRLLGAQHSEDRDRLISASAALAPESETPVVLPFFAGSPAGLEASGTISGLRSWHGPEHLMRGVLEGIALMHHWHLSALAEAFDFTGDVALGGGISRSTHYAQLVADVLGRPVRVACEDEPGAFGAAALAAVHLGLVESMDAAQSLAQLDRPIFPDADHMRWQRKRMDFDELIRANVPWWKEQSSAR